MTRSPPPLPEEVYISHEEALPRALVATCAKKSWRRCGGGGWYWYWLGARRVPFLCPCAQEGVRKHVAEAKAGEDASAARLERPILEVVVEAFEDFSRTAGCAPAALVCAGHIAADIRAAAGERVKLLEHGGFGIQITAAGAERNLLVWPDPEAPKDTAYFFGAEDWARIELQLRDRDARRAAEAQREREAADSIAKMRADLVGSRAR